MHAQIAQETVMKPTQRETEYLSVTDTAKLIRKRLKALYPKVKFSVRSRKYAGGASIDVETPVDFPDADLKKVDSEIAPFQSRGFDGMIDMSYGKTTWLLPDGSVTPAESSGTEGSGGLAPGYVNPAPHPDARKISSGANYIFVQKAWR
ncbi:MAG: LPD29 domain-containing protein [Hoeflea sp.]|uniref:LPD29 domain-containing protein n=1 Tax=Hoeflea sp. TaxID=1940281 RepID=UPI0032EE1619